MTPRQAAWQLVADIEDNTDTSGIAIGNAAVFDIEGDSDIGTVLFGNAESIANEENFRVFFSSDEHLFGVQFDQK